MEELRVADAMTEIFNLFKRCNKYIDETMPWVLAKDEAKKDRLETVLWNLIQSISRGAELLESFMPSTSKKDSGAARKWSCNRKTGNPLRKTGSGRSSEKK